MRSLVPVIFSFLVFSSLLHAQEIPKPSRTPVNPDEAKEVEVIFQRFNEAENLNLFQTTMEAVTFGNEDDKRLEDVTKGTMEFLVAMGRYVKGDREDLEKLGGVKGFKENLILWLKSDDLAIRAFAAIVAGIKGDREFVPILAKFLEQPPGKSKERYAYDRNRAMIGLARLGATGQISRIAEFIKSTDAYERSGAVIALKEFGAKQYGNEIAAMLVKKEFAEVDDASPITYLVETGLAADHKAELVIALAKKNSPSTVSSAMYALASIDAKEYAADIAKLLDDRDLKGEAAKALALMDARDYTDRIGQMLNDRNPSVKAASMLSLAILGARKYSPQIAKFITNRDEWIYPYSAVALLLLDAEKYRADEALVNDAALLNDNLLGDFSPLVEKKVVRVTERLEKIIEAAKVKSVQK